jgi:predicted glycoside hydrolase/deacetylase ChbG (UPF0249 family)
MKRLIVNADDFGWSEAVTSGIIQGHLQGLITSTTLMVNLSGTAETLARARRETPKLAIGLHLNLTEGTPLSAEAAVMVGETGQFRRSLPALFWKSRRSPDVRRAIAAELEAQAAWAKDHGLTISHFDSHKHVHMHPAILPVVIALALRHGVRAIRTTAEIELPDVAKFLPADWGLPARLAQGVRTAVARRWGLAAKAAVARAGLATTDWFFGVRATGGVSAPLIQHLLQHGPDGTGELMVHPGLLDSNPGRSTRLNQSRPRELEAVMEPTLPAAAQTSGWKLVTFEELSRDQ